jgi:hypothetical protein
MFDDVAVNGFEGLAQWCEQVLGQAPKEEAPNQVDVARRGLHDGSLAAGSQPDFSPPPVRGSNVAPDQTAALHSLGMVRHAAPLPSDLGCKGAHLHALAGHSAQSVEDVIVGKRKFVVRLELAVHLVPQPLLNPHEGEPGTELAATKPNV